MANTLQGLGSPLTFRRAGQLGLEALAGYAQLDPTQQAQYQREAEIRGRSLAAAQAKTGTLGARSGAFQTAELQRGLIADAEGRRLQAGQTLAGMGLQSKEIASREDIAKSGIESAERISGAEITSREKIAGQQLEFEKGSFAQTLALKQDQLAQDATLFRENIEATKENITTQQDWQSAESVLDRQFKEGMLSTQQSYDASKQLLQNAHEKGMIDDQQLFQAEQAVEERKLKRDSLAQDATLFRENLEATAENIQSQGDVQEALLLLRQQGEMKVLDSQQQFAAEQAVLSHARSKDLLTMQQLHDEEQRALDRKQRNDEFTVTTDNEREGGLFGALGNIAGAVAGTLLGGPGVGTAVGGAVGGGVVDFVGSLFGGGK